MEISRQDELPHRDRDLEIKDTYRRFLKALQKNETNITDRLKSLDETFQKTDRLGRAWYRLYVEGEEKTVSKELRPDARFAYKCTVASIYEVWQFLEDIKRKELIAKKATSLPSVTKLDGNITIDLSEKSQIEKEKILEAFEISNHDVNATFRRVFLHLKYWLKNYAKNVPSYLATEENLLLGFEIATKRWNELISH